MIYVIPIFRPSMGEEEISAVSEVLRSGWIGLGPKTKEFEDAFAKYIGAKYAIALNSCTSALQLALNALNIANGEVITTPITFISTAHSILYNNLKPIFADVQEDTLNINPKDVERNITEKTRAIIPVHYGGHPCEMDEIKEIAKKHNLYLIEDAAHACGSEYKRRKVGVLGDMACFSFHAVKNLATGDGGMITTDNSDLYEKLMKLRWLGIGKSTYQRKEGKGYSWYYEADYVGFKAHMNDINAAIGLIQLKKLDNMNAKRRKIVSQYNKAFEELSWIKLPTERSYVKSSLHNYVIKVEKGDRNELISHLANNGISAGVHYMPLYLHPIYRNMNIKGNCPIADRIWEKIVSLPLYPDMAVEDIEKVIEAVKEFTP